MVDSPNKPPGAAKTGERVDDVQVDTGRNPVPVHLRETVKRMPSVAVPKDAPPDSAPPISGFPFTSRPPRSREGSDEPELTQAGLTLAGLPALARQRAVARKAYITVIVGNRAGEMFKLSDQQETVLGRGQQCTIHLDSDGVSRRHARIVPFGGEYSLEDLKSTNGTWVNQQRVSSQRLVEGDQVQIGTEVIVRFNYHDEMEAQLQQQLYESAVRDPLTRAHNRKYFQERMTAEINHAERHKTRLSLIFLDIDHFKTVNDTYGHPGGDVVLRTLAAAVQKVIRIEDVFARIGGEEFALLARGIDAAAAVAFAERLRRGIERMQIPWQGATIPITSSFGVASVADLVPPFSGDELIAAADKRLYAAKAAGRNRVVGP